MKNFIIACLLGLNMSMCLSLGYTVRVLREVNNPLGYELIEHQEIEDMRLNLRKWQHKAMYYARLLAKAQHRPFNWRKVVK